MKTRPLFHKDLRALSDSSETIIFHVRHPGKPSIYRYFEHDTSCNPLIIGFCGYQALVVLILQEVMSDRYDFEQHLRIMSSFTEAQEKYLAWGRRKVAVTVAHGEGRISVIERVNLPGGASGSERRWMTFGCLGARSHFSGQASSRAWCEVAIRFNRFQRPAL